MNQLSSVKLSALARSRQRRAARFLVRGDAREAALMLDEAIRLHAEAWKIETEHRATARALNGILDLAARHRLASKTRGRRH